MTQDTKQKNGRPSVVLVASDQEWTARSIDSILGPQGYAVLRAYTGRQALDLALSTSPDAIILDTRIRDISGFEVCQRLRSEGRISALTPVLLIAATPSARAERLQAFAVGAWEYFAQPLDGELLLAQLQTFLAAKEEGDRMREEALVDAATGLYSMRGLARRAREIGAEAYRLGVPLACVAISPIPRVDNGDVSVDQTEAQATVEHIGAILLEAGRVSDAIGRFGQYEFGVVAPATDAQGVLKLVERLRSALANSSNHIGVAQGFRVNVGYHAVPNFADSQVDAVEMLLRASTALHSAAGSEAHDLTLAFESTGSNVVS